MLVHPAPRGDYVLRAVEERGVPFVRLWFVDVLGVLKSLAIPVSELEQALAEGVGIDGSSLEGTARLRERDAIAHPDPEMFQLMPWRAGSIVGASDLRRRAIEYVEQMGIPVRPRTTSSPPPSTRSTCITRTRSRWPTP